MKKIFFIIIIFIIIIFPNLVFAKKITCNSGEYTVSLDLSKDKINIDESVNITIDSNHSYEISYEVANNKIVSISEDGEIKGLKEGSTTINSYVKFIDLEDQIGNCKMTIDLEVISSDATLKELNIEEYDISDIFKPDKYEYIITLPFNMDKINIIATPNNEKSIVTGNGRRYLNDNDNEYEVHVVSTNGAAKTYKIIVNKEQPNDDSSLKYLIVEGYVLNPKFNKEIYAYSLSVDKDIDSIVIKAEPNSNLASINGIGTFSLASGDNKYQVTVTAEDNSKSTYEIIIHKNNGTSKLKNMEIKNIKLDEEFNTNIYIYHITIGNKIEKLDIKLSTEENDEYEIIGNDSLQTGLNEILIKVKGKDKTTTTYKLIVNKLTKTEEKKIEKNNRLAKILLIMFIIAILFMGTSISIFIKRNYKKRK